MLFGVYNIKMFTTIFDRKIRIAVIGCGRISKNHFDAISKNKENIELVAVCDTNQIQLDEHSGKYHVKGYLSFENLLNEIKPDLVALCTPSGLHAEQAIIAAKKGVNVITEKPMATRWQDGRNMVIACNDARVRLFVVKQNRLNPTIQLLKRAINENRFGKIYLVNLNVFWTRPQEYYDSAAWRGTWDLDGGAFMNQASHYVDLLDWLIGPVSDVQAMTGTLGRNIQVEDSGVMNIRWRNGALGSMNVTMLTYPKNLEGSITILGENGTVRIGGGAINEIQIWDFKVNKKYDESIMSANYQLTSLYGFGHFGYYQNVINVLRGKESPETDGREGLKSLEILIAAYLSARDRKTISLPLEY